MTDDRVLKVEESTHPLQFSSITEGALLDSLQKTDSRSCCIDLSVSTQHCVSIASRTAEI